MKLKALRYFFNKLTTGGLKMIKEVIQNQFSIFKGHEFSEAIFLLSFPPKNHLPRFLPQGSILTMSMEFDKNFSNWS